MLCEREFKISERDTNNLEQVSCYHIQGGSAMWPTTRDWLYRNARRYPAKLAISNRNVRFTFSELAERCNRLANALLNRGLQKGDRVAFIDRTNPWYLELYYGVTAAGFVALPVNYRFAAREILFVLNNCQPKALIVGKDFIEVINSIRHSLPFVEHYISLVPADGYEYYEQVLAASAEGEPPIEPSAEDAAVICLTSGTTAVPKCAVLTHRSIAASGVNVCLGINLSFDDKVYYPAALFHVMGCMAMTMLARGCTLVYEDFAPQLVCETITYEKPSVVVAAITPLAFLVNSGLNFADYDLSSVRTILGGAGPNRRVVGLKLFDVFPNLEEVYYAYALSEASPIVTCGVVATREGALRGEYSEDSGREGYVTVTKVVDDNGKELPPGQPGEIIVRGPNVFSGYWGMPEETASAIRSGWLYTGDIGYFDTDGRLRVVDRKKDMILTGSENVASVEVESVLCQHPAIAEAAVIGVPDETWGERVHAVIVLKPGCNTSPEDIISFCRQYLAGYKVPKSVDFVETLPRNATGKVLKGELRVKYTRATSSS